MNGLLFIIKSFDGKNNEFNKIIFIFSLFFRIEFDRRIKNLIVANCLSYTYYYLNRVKVIKPEDEKNYVRHNIANNLIFFCFKNVQVHCKVYQLLFIFLFILIGALRTENKKFILCTHKLSKQQLILHHYGNNSSMVLQFIFDVVPHEKQKKKRNELK